MKGLIAPIVAVGGALALSLAFASCSAFESDTGPPVETEGGAADGPLPTCAANLAIDHANCGQCGHACAAIESCEKGACRAGCPDKIIYVSGDTGDDAHDGCAIDRPMKSIGAAIARAKAIQAKDHAIEVCRGVYGVTDLLLDYPVSLRGGYECTSFKRTADFGSPKFDPTTTTTIQDSSTGVERNALLVRGAAITRATIIDGFTIIGSPSGTAQSAAVALADASPLLRDLVVFGGGTSSPTGLASRGVVAANASFELAFSVINGGQGTSLNPMVFDVIGVHIVGGKPYLHDLTVQGTPSSAPRALTAAVYVQESTSTGADAWHDLTLDAGVVTYTAAALQVAGGTLELSKSKLTGPRVGCQHGTGGDCSAFAVLTGESTLTISQSRIYGGDVVAPLGMVGVDEAIYAEHCTTTLTNNFIVSGNGSRQPTSWVNGIVVTRSLATLIAHNTVVASELSTSPDGRVTGIYLANNGVGADIENNLIVGNALPSSAAVGLHLEASCAPTPGSRPASFRNNAFVNVARIADVFDGSSCTIPSKPVTIAAAETALGGATFASGNVRLAAGCVGDSATACKTCASAQECASLVVSPWTMSSPSAQELFVPPGYAIPTGAPCLVATGGVPLAAKPVMIDLDGAKRGPKPSIGAFELAGACAN